MSSDAESAASDEAPLKVEKTSGRRNPRRSSRNAVPKKSEDSPEKAGRRTRKRTDSQSSDSETHQTRSRSTRNRKKSSSPNYRSRRGGAKEGTQETPATRVKSARRASSRVNYKESEGEEDPIPEEPKKDEEDYDLEDDWEDSGDDGKKKKEVVTKRSTRTRKSSSNSPNKESKAKGKSKARQAPSRRSDRSTRSRKKYGEEDEEEEEEEEIEEQESNSNEATDGAKVTDKKKEVDEVDKAKKKDEKTGKEEVAEKEKSPAKEEKVEKKEEEDKKEPNSIAPKPAAQESSSEKESLKRKATEALVEETKKPKVEILGDIKENPAYLRKSPVIVENKQFLESSKEVSGESQPNPSQPQESSSNIPVENQHKAPAATPSLNLNGLTSKDGMVFNPSVSPEKRESLKGRTFSLLAYNVADFDSGKPTSILEDLKAHSSDIICFQSLPLSFYSEKLEPTFKQLGYSGVINDSLITLFQSDKFQLVNNSAISLQSIVAKNLEDKPSELSEATKNIFNDCYGKAQLVELQFVPENLQLNVCNLALPTQLDPSSSTLLMCRLLQAVDSSPGKPLILCGQFAETNWLSQLLECGKLSEEITKEMTKRKDVTTIKNQEPKSLIELLPSLYECPSRQYINCFTSIMGPQVGSNNPVQLWISSLQTIAVSSPSTILASIAFAN